MEGNFGRREAGSGKIRRGNIPTGSMYTDISTETIVSLSVVNILVGTLCILFNLSIIRFYSKKSSKIVAMIYTILAFMDLLVGISAVYQSIPLITLLYDTTDNVQLKAVIYTISFILDNIAAKSSVFMNVLLVVSRTIAILSPFYLLSRKLIKISIAIFVGLLFPLIANDIWKHFEELYSDAFSSVNAVEYLSRYLFLMPMLGSKLSDNLFEKSQLDIRNYTLNSYYHLASLVCLVCMIIQIVALHKPRPGDDQDIEHRITITIILLSGVFFVCNTTYTLYVSTQVGNLGREIDTMEFVGLYLTGTQLQFLNSLISPCIMIFRGGENLKKFTKNFIMCKSFSVVRDSFFERVTHTSSIT